MRIITVDREFGSGGRELGKRLADALQIPWYDQEIIWEVAKMQGIDPVNIDRILKSDIQVVYPLTIGKRFNASSLSEKNNIQVITLQDVIKALTSKGDCVIVGRCADLVLREMNPLNLFVYATKDSKLLRCKYYASENESEQDILWQMQKIDHDRSAFRALLSDSKWGEKENYHLCVNTSGKTIKELIPGLVTYVDSWFNAS